MAYALKTFVKLMVGHCPGRLEKPNPALHLLKHRSRCPLSPASTLRYRVRGTAAIGILHGSKPGTPS